MQAKTPQAEPQRSRAEWFKRSRLNAMSAGFSIQVVKPVSQTPDVAVIILVRQPHFSAVRTVAGALSALDARVVLDHETSQTWERPSTLSADLEADAHVDSVASVFEIDDRADVAGSLRRFPHTG